MAAPSVDRRATLRRYRAGIIRRLPAPIANGLRSLTRPFRVSAQEPHQLANLQATVVGAMATNEAGIVGLSQEVARLSARVDELTERLDALAAERVEPVEPGP